MFTQLRVSVSWFHLDGRNFSICEDEPTVEAAPGGETFKTKQTCSFIQLLEKQPGLEEDVSGGDGREDVLGSVQRVFC